MEHECPICKDSFETEAGLSAHNRSKKHHYNVKMEDKDIQIKQLISLLLSLHPEKKENVELRKSINQKFEFKQLELEKRILKLEARHKN
jgi:hypothetical protein